MALDERAGPEALHHAGLARAAVADQHDLEQVVKALVVARAHHQVVGVAARHSHRDSRGDEGDGGDGRIRTLPTSRMTIYAIAVSTKPLVHPVASILVHLTTPLQSVSAANRGTADPPLPVFLLLFSVLFFFARLRLSVRIINLFSTRCLSVSYLWK